MRILVTGASGFAGKYLCDRLLEDDHEVEAMVRRPTASRKNVNLIYHDFRAPIPDRILHQLEDVDSIVHLGAEVHGLRSLDDPELFVHTNAVGTFNLLEAARKIKPRTFIYVSSAEAVGSAPYPESLTEDAALNPSNPYSAAKAAGEMLVQSYARSFGVPAMIVRTMNLFGERQTTGKFVPDTVKKMLNGETITIHTDSNGVSGSRQWLHVCEFVNALYFLLFNGQAGETYHVAGTTASNAQIVTLIGTALRIPWKEHIAIPGRTHDMRYSIKDMKLPSEAYDTCHFQSDLAATTQWYKAHPEFLR